MSTTECRFEVIKRILVGEVQNGEAHRQLGSISAQQIVSSGTQIKKMSRRDTRWIRVIVFRSVRRNAHAQRAPVARVAYRYGVGERRKGAATEESDLLLLIRRES